MRRSQPYGEACIWVSILLPPMSAVPWYMASWWCAPSPSWSQAMFPLLFSYLADRRQWQWVHIALKMHLPYFTKRAVYWVKGGIEKCKQSEIEQLLMQKLKYLTATWIWGKRTPKYSILCKKRGKSHMSHKHEFTDFCWRRHSVILFHTFFPLWIFTFLMCPPVSG